MEAGIDNPICHIGYGGIELARNLKAGAAHRVVGRLLGAAKVQGEQPYAEPLV